MKEMIARCWLSEYRHITYEIKSWGRWAAYIVMNSHQRKFDYEIARLPSGNVFYHHHVDDVLSVLSDTAHGGITFYEVHTRPGDDTEYYKIGWDYSHLWDEDETWDEDIILWDVKAVVDELWRVAPDTRVHCFMVGGYHHISDGYTTADGGFISNAGVEYCHERGLKLPEKAETPV